MPFVGFDPGLDLPVDCFVRSHQRQISVRCRTGDDFNHPIILQTAKGTYQVPLVSDIKILLGLLEEIRVESRQVGHVRILVFLEAGNVELRRLYLLVEVGIQVVHDIPVGQLFDQDWRQPDGQAGWNSFSLERIEGVQQRNVRLRCRFVNPLLPMGPAASHPRIG